MAGPDERMRIGELSRRTGVAPDLLRAWERRYGLLTPMRTPGGFRLYGADDVARVRRMTDSIAAGLPASIAARRSLQGEEPATSRGPVPPGALVDELERSLAAFDEAGANAVFDQALATLTVTSLLSDVVMPYLQRLGARWESGEATIAQEHFATGIVRGRLLGLARAWGTGPGPVAVLACPPGEQHDLGLIAFGLGLRGHGWRIVMLGPNTPITTIAEVADRVAPALIVVASMQPAPFDTVRHELAALGRSHRLGVGGPGADRELAAEVGAILISGAPLDAAAELAATVTP